MSNTETPKSWWSLSKASSNKEIRENYIEIKPRSRRPSNAARTAAGFKSIVEAIGLKSKKPPKEPLSSLGSPTDGFQPLDVVRAPKSSSSTLSPVDSPEPYDKAQQPTQSLLTLADDPFAGHSPVVAIIQSPAPSRLSVYSGSSFTDLASCKTRTPVYRASYVSSSTNSYSHGSESSSPIISVSPHGLPESKKLRLKRSVGSMQVKLSDNLSRQTSFMSSISKSSHLEESQQVRPKMRSRGMTDRGMPQKAGFFVKEQIVQHKSSQVSTTSNVLISTNLTEPTKPRLVVRQASSSRLHAPPTAPPTVSLPATPHPPAGQPNPCERKGIGLLPFSISSSSLSFNDHATTLDPFDSEKRDLFIAEEPMAEIVEHSPKTAPSSLLTPKKTPSQRSLRRATPPSASASSKSTITPEPPSDKGKRNSQQSRLPIPTLSLSIRTSFSSTPPQTRNVDSPSATAEPRKSRKRLFSNSSQRPSTSACVSTIPREDDTLSVLSIRSDRDAPFNPHKPWAVTRTYPSSSFWDEDTTPSSSNFEYQPQAIMTRDELAKFEASIASGTESRQQTSLNHHVSSPPLVTSSQIENLGHDQDIVALSPPPSLRLGDRGSVRTSSANLTSHSAKARRPVTADPLIRDSSAKDGGEGTTERLDRSHIASIGVAQSDLIPALTSLPPPPRPRLQSSNSIQSATVAATAKMIATPIERLSSSKLPERPHSVITTTSPLQPGAPGGGLKMSMLPVPRPVLRGKMQTSGVLEKAIHRRSLMRKPSFLEIDGETDPDSEPEVDERRDSLFLSMKAQNAADTLNINGYTNTGESFLDFARESFDTGRR